MTLEELKTYVVAKNNKINARRVNDERVISAVNAILPRDDLSHTEKLSMIVFNGGDVCKECHNNTLQSISRKNPYVCVECVETIRQQKRKETNILKYGHEHPMKSAAIKTKVSHTNLERYGHANPSQNGEVKEKTRKTNLERYGSTHVGNSAAIRTKITETNLKKYGSSSPLGNKDVITKKDETVLERYGVNNVSQLPHVKQLSKENDPRSLSNREYESRVVEDVNSHYEEYKNSNMSIKEYSEKIGMAHSTMVKLFKKHDLPVFYRSKYQKMQTRFYDRLVEMYPDITIIMNDRSAISPKEIDIYFPDNKLGIEVNGWYWHSEDNTKVNKRHIEKFKLAKDRGIQLLQFWDHEIDLQENIVFSIIRSKLGQNEDKVYARKTQIVELDNNTYKAFCNENHLQGSGIAKYRYGLMYNGRILSVMSFSKSRYTKECDYEMVRYCNTKGTTVVGGASKLFKYFIKHLGGSIVSYADARISDGNLYESLGFDFKHHSQPNYFYIKEYGNLESRVKYQKHKLEAVLNIYDPLLSEKQNMLNNKFRILYDAGNLVYIYAP